MTPKRYATCDATVIRFDRNGPPGKGMEEWEAMNPDDLMSGAPVQNGHIYHQIEAQGYLAGVWDCTAFTDHMVPYSVDEFMYLLEGTLIMRMPDGAEIHLQAGDAFIIPKGLECQWEQPGYIRKFFMILDGPVPETGAQAALGRITLPDLSGAGGDGLINMRTDFLNAAGNMRVDVSDHAAAHIPHRPVLFHELIQVLEGQLMLTSDGTTETFGAGDTAYLCQGGTVGWETAEGTRLLTSSYFAPG